MSVTEEVNLNTEDRHRCRRITQQEYRPGKPSMAVGTGAVCLSRIRISLIRLNVLYGRAGYFFFNLENIITCDRYSK